MYMIQHFSPLKLPAILGIIKFFFLDCIILTIFIPKKKKKNNKVIPYSI